MIKKIIFLCLTSLIFVSNTVLADSPVFSSCSTDDCKLQFKKFKKLARQGSPNAQSIIASMYSSGYGVEEDSEKAVKWIKKAARAGDVQARYSVALINLLDKDEPAAITKGIKVLKLLADKGISKASYRLAEIYLTGELIEKDIHTAEKWLSKGADIGHSNSQYSLGLLYESGLLGKKDVDKAIIFYKKASTKHSLAYERLSQLEPNAINNIDNKNNINFDNIERIEVNAPELEDILNFAFEKINAQSLYTTNVQTGSRIKGRSCTKILSVNCASMTNRQDIEYFMMAH
jgi:hypothetical protein